MKKRKFYNFARDETTGERELYIDGEIAENVWFGDEITAKDFKEQLFSGTGSLTLWISSPGGDVVSASEIYAMLKDYQGEITVKIYGMAASAATVIAMAGDRVLMSPTALFLIHNPQMLAVGDSAEMRKAGAMLDAVKDSIINAYELKTGLPRAKISKLMDLEQPMDANYAIALGFADGMIESPKSTETENPIAKTTQIIENKTTIKSLYERLNLLSGGKFYV